jgi:hypothetical protein
MYCDAKRMEKFVKIPILATLPVSSASAEDKMKMAAAAAAAERE